MPSVKGRVNSWSGYDRGIFVVYRAWPDEDTGAAITINLSPGEGMGLVGNGVTISWGEPEKIARLPPSPYCCLQSGEIRDETETLRRKVNELVDTVNALTEQQAGILERENASKRSG